MTASKVKQVSEAFVHLPKPRGKPPGHPAGGAGRAMFSNGTSRLIVIRQELSGTTCQGAQCQGTNRRSVLICVGACKVIRLSEYLDDSVKGQTGFQRHLFNSFLPTRVVETNKNEDKHEVVADEAWSEKKT